MSLPTGAKIGLGWLRRRSQLVLKCAEPGLRVGFGLAKSPPLARLGAPTLIGHDSRDNAHGLG